MSSQKSSPSNIPALTGIRALAAFLVLGLHAHQNVPTNIVSYFPIIERGYLGVDFFFVLSGFIITHVYLASFDRLNVETLRIFFWHRFIRLYPVHIAVLFMMIVMAVASRMSGQTINAESFNAVDLIWQLTLVHAWGVTGVATWNVPSWSISAEWFAYLMFPVIALVLNRLSHAGLAYLLSLLALVLMALVFTLAGDGIDSWNGPLALLRVTGEFTCGTALCRAMSIETSCGERLWNGDLLGSVAFAAFCIAASFALSDYLLVGLLALTIMGAAAADGFFKNVLASSPMVWFGEISYSIYMVHFPVLIVLRRVFEKLGYAVWTPIVQLTALILTFGVVIAAAATLYYVVERPIRTRLRDRFGVIAAHPSISKALA